MCRDLADFTLFSQAVRAPSIRAHTLCSGISFPSPPLAQQQLIGVQAWEVDDAGGQHHRGNTVGITGSSGTYVNQYSYLPFGETTTVSAALPNLFTFAGQSE